MASSNYNLSGALSCVSISGNGAGITGIPITNLSGTEFSSSVSQGDKIVYDGASWTNVQQGGLVYVNASAPANGTGSEEYPFQSIGKAANYVNAYNSTNPAIKITTIFVADGIYPDTFYAPTAATIKSISGNKRAAIISGTVYCTNLGGSTQATCDLDGFTFTGGVFANPTGNAGNDIFVFLTIRNSTLSNVSNSNNGQNVAVQCIKGTAVSVLNSTITDIFSSNGAITLSNTLLLGNSPNWQGSVTLYNSVILPSVAMGSGGTVTSYGTRFINQWSIDGGASTINADTTPPGGFAVTNGATFTYTGAAPVLSMEQLSDVKATNISARHLLTYNGAQWTNVPSSGSDRTKNFYVVAAQNSNFTAGSTQSYAWVTSGGGVIGNFNITGTFGSLATLIQIPLPNGITLPGSNYVVGFAQFVASSGTTITVPINCGALQNTQTYNTAAFTIPSMNPAVSGTVLGTFTCSLL